MAHGGLADSPMHSSSATPSSQVTSSLLVVLSYALEMLYHDQPLPWVVDAVPAVLAWISGKGPVAAPGPHVFQVAHMPVVGGPTQEAEIALTWDVQELEKRDPHVLNRAVRYHAGETVHREHLAEVAAYGLAFVAMSLFLPGARVVTMRRGSAPDILYDDTPGALRGVEVAGRHSGGRGALRAVRIGSGKSTGKSQTLLAMSDVLEVHLSLWCRSPAVAEMIKVKP
jgi:hypothetical protein